MMPSFEPAILVRRGPLAESLHAAVAAVASADGEILASLGDPTHLTFPRSSLKPIQALALVESGAADAFGLDERHLALACGSHRGEPFHTELVGAWLKRIGCAPEDLACGADLPADPATRDALIRRGGTPTRLHHNCSGKHTGFLTVCRHCGWPTAGYDAPEHPAQRRYLETLGELAGLEPAAMPLGTDGCTLPAPALPVVAMARAVARFAGCRDRSAVRRAAMERLLAAMRAKPELVSGTGQATVALNRATGGRVLAKTGAEGYLMAFLPESGLGIALKIADGHGRAAFPLLVEILAGLGELDDGALGVLEAIRRPRLTDSRGRVVGGIEASAAALRRA